MSSPSLYDTPARPRKRARTTTLAPRRLFGSVSRPRYRIPRSLLPEMKQFVKTQLFGANADEAYSSIPLDLTQGDDGNQFVGTKIRIKRLRVMYDFTGYSTPTTTAIRISVVIPKDVNFPPAAGTIVSNRYTPINTHDYTVLHDRLVPLASGDYRVGQFDVTMNLPVEFSLGGTSVRKNDLIVIAYSPGNGTAARAIMGYAVWYTDS